MKKIFNSFLIVAVIASVASISSCTKTCDAGYEGSDCKTEVRAKFVGTYKVSGTIVTGGVSTAFADQTLTIATSSANLQNILLTFGGATVTASTTGTTMTIASQVINVNYTYTGTGSIANNVISFTITETDNTGGVPTVYNITGSGPKQ